MPNRTIRTAAACLLLSLCLTAQEEPRPSETPVAVPTQSPVMVVSMAFRGGTMPQFVAALQKEQPQANIVLAPRCGEANVPPLELRGTDIEQALETACLLAEGKVEIRHKRIGGRGQPIHMILAREYRPAQVTGAGVPEALVQRVFTLNPLTMDRAMPEFFVKAAGDGLVKPLAVEAVLSAVELAATIDGKAPVLRYHKDSGLLIVRGTVEQVSMAGDTLGVLEQDLQRRYDLLQEKLQREEQFGKARQDWLLPEKGLLPAEAGDEGNR